MESSLTCKFYRVDKKDPKQVEFVDCLRQLVGKKEVRVVNASGSMAAAINVTESKGYITGDLVRLESDNLLSIVHEGKVSTLSLPEGAKIANHTAFAFRINGKFLAYQLNRSSVSLSQFNLIASGSGNAIFNLQPVVKASELSKLQTIRAKTFTFTVADPFDLDAVEDEQKELRASLIDMMGQSHGAYISIKIGMGNASGNLDEGFLKGALGWMLEQKAKNRGKVRRMKVAGKGCNEKNDIVNFIKAHVGFSQEVDFSGKNHIERYEARRTFLLSAFVKRAGELSSFTRK